MHGQTRQSQKVMCILKASIDQSREHPKYYFVHRVFTSTFQLPVVQVVQVVQVARVAQVAQEAQVAKVLHS